MLPGPYSGSQSSRRPRRRGVVLLALCALLCAAPPAARAADAPTPAAAAPWQGRSLATVLEELRAAGIGIVYSDALIGPDLAVRDEPAPGRPLERLRAALAQHGLRLVAAGADGWAVVRNARTTTPSPSPLPVEGRPPPGTLDEVSVVATRYRVESSRVTGAPATLGRPELEHQPASFEDAARALRRFPGVTGTPLSARHFVRGGLPDENLVLLDGVPLHEPFHLQGLPVEFGVVDPAALDRVSLYTGVLPVEYSGRMSAVVAMQTRAPAERFGGRLALGTLHGSALLESPFAAGRGAALLSARRTTADAAVRLLRPELGRPRYADVLARVALALAPGLDLSFGMLGADDELQLERRELGEQVSGGTDRNHAWAALDWSAPTVRLRSRLSRGQVSSLRSGARADAAGLRGVLRDERRHEQWELRQDASGVARGFDWRAGALLREERARYDYSRAVAFAADVDAFFGRTAEPPLALAAAARQRDAEAWLGFTATPVGGLELETGAHALRARPDRGARVDVLDPRLGVAWHFADGTRVRLAWGRATQSWNAGERPVEFGDASARAASRARTWTLGLESRVAGAAVRAEAYDTHVARPRARRENQLDPVALVPELRADVLVVAPRDARLRGVEVQASGSIGEAVGLWTTAAWSEATERIDGRRVARGWEQRWSLAGGVTWQHGPWLWAGSLAAHEGWPRTPLAATDAAPGLVLGAPNATRTTEYFQLDLRVERRFALPVGSLNAVLEVANATANDNYCCSRLRWTRGEDGTLAVEARRRDWLPVVPYFGVAWEF